MSDHRPSDLELLRLKETAPAIYGLLESLPDPRGEFWARPLRVAWLNAMNEALWLTYGE